MSSHISSSHVLIVGTVRNISAKLQRNLFILEKAFDRFNQVDFFLIESDSTDNTIEELNKLSQRHSNVNFVSLGKLEFEFPNRVKRLAHCRNKYISHIREEYKSQNWDFIVVADLDDVNLKLTKTSVDSCFNSEIQWDACTANQSFGYFDLYALRAKYWLDVDYMDELAWRNSLHGELLENSLNKFQSYLERDRYRREIIYSRMKKIHPNTNWIKVESAFGGIAIYKPAVFLDCDYTPTSQITEYQCEHVNLHEQMQGKFPGIYINPAFINSHWNEHNLNRLFLVRLYRHLRRVTKPILNRFKKFKNTFQ
jgi:hypothetical protein